MSEEREAVSALTGNVVRFRVHCTPPASPDFMETPLTSIQYYQVVEEYSSLRTSPRTRREKRYKPYTPACKKKLDFEHLIVNKLKPKKLPVDKCIAKGQEGADAPEDTKLPINKCVAKGQEGADAPEEKNYPSTSALPRGGERELMLPKIRNYPSTSALPRGGREGTDFPEDTKLPINKWFAKKKLPIHKLVTNGGQEGADASEKKKIPIDKFVTNGGQEGADASEEKKLHIDKCVPKEAARGQEEANAL